MESSLKNSCSVIQYYKGTLISTNNTDVINLNSFDSKNSVDQDLKEVLMNKNDNVFNKEHEKESFQQDNIKSEMNDICETKMVKVENIDTTLEPIDSNEVENKKEDMGLTSNSKTSFPNICTTEDAKCSSESEKNSCFIEEKNMLHSKDIKEEIFDIKSNEGQQPNKGRKRKFSSTIINESTSSINSKDEATNEETLDSDIESTEDADKPRRRGRKKGKRSAEAIPVHLSSDMVLGYKMLLRFLEAPQFSAFHKPFKKNSGIDDSVNKTDDFKITCLNQIKKKFEDNSYKMVSEFVNDVREMLINIYESRNPVATKRALRLEQVLEQRIAQLPNYLRPQCALILPPDEINNSHNKIRISKGGGFISLLLEKTEKQRFEKNKEKRKLLAEERKQIKEEQNKDVQEWEKNVLLKGYDEDIKSMWELPAIGHFIYLCTDILNIGEIAQFEVERMLLMPQCSDTLDLIMTALLTNSLVRAKLDRTPSMPYSIWSPLVRTRVVSWYRTWHKEGKNEQKLFEEIGIEPAFWQILGPDINPLDYYYFHEISLFQRVWVLKTLCDVDFVRKKTVYENIRTQALEELNPVNLGLDRHGNRYIHLKQFCFSDLRIYRQSTVLEGNLTLSEFVENFTGFEDRAGPVTIDKVFRDIWESSDKIEVKVKRKKIRVKKQQKIIPKVVPDLLDKKNLRQSVRAKQKTYVDWSDSDLSDTDLDTLKKKLTQSDSNTLHRPFSDKEFISLSVFRLPRDKVTKPTTKKSKYCNTRLDDLIKNEGAINDKSMKGESEDIKDDCKISVLPGEDDRSDSVTSKQMDCDKNFQNDDVNGDDFDLKEKLGENSKLDQVNDDVKFTVKNLQDLKMVFKKGSISENFSEKSDLISDKSMSIEGKTSSAEKSGDSYKYIVPDHLKPDSNKFYLVVDSVEGLRQLISKFGSHENDLEIITRSTKSKKKIVQNNKSCEIELIERLQKLLVELEPWELDFMKSSRTNKEKMYREYINFINRPSDFVHPNEAYWMKTYEEPATSTTSATSTTTTTTTTSSSYDANTSNLEKNEGKEGTTNAGDVTESSDQNNSDILGPRKRTRVTRLQLQPEDKEVDDDDSDFDVESESNESDDNWVLPTPKRKAKKETPVKTSKYPRRSVGKKLKFSPLEKTESRLNAAEKSQNLSPEKAKKALFWGPRSSDPSEDLNWEKNRQKILEQHNSPVKKVVFRYGENKEQESIFQKAEEKPASVIKASPKRFTAQIPGNKKPYFSSAQLKAMENSAKQKKRDEEHLVQQKEATCSGSDTNINLQQSENKTSPTTSELLFFNSAKGGPVKLQTYSKLDKAIAKPAAACTTQISNKSKQAPLTQLVVPAATKFENNSKIQEPLKFSTKTQGQVQRAANSVLVSQPQMVPDSRSVIQQKVMGQIQQPSNQVHQIQIQDSSLVTQNKIINTSASDIKLTQPVHWQPKVVSVQTVNQQGKIVSQNPTQAQVQNQAQVTLQTQSQANIQQVIQLEPQKRATIQKSAEVQTDKQSQQVVVSQPKTCTSTSDNDLFITDGKLLLKCDNNFIQQYMQKDKVVTLNIHEKFDLKKPLLIVKPKVDSNQNANTDKGETSGQQQNILILKPTTVQQTVVSNPAPTVGAPTNFILKEGTQQPQFIKIITSQPIGSNQKIILSPSNITLNNINIRTSSPTVVASDQQSKSAATLRFYSPQVITSNSVNVVQNKTTGTVQNPVVVNKIVQIQGSPLDSAKPQLVAGRLVSASVPTVRMVTPVQASNLATHTVRLSSQPLQQVKGSSSQTQIITSSTLNPVTIGTTSASAVRLSSNNVQTVVASPNIQALGAHTSGNSVPLKVASVQSHQVMQPQSSSSNANTLSTTNANLGSQTFRLANNIQTIQVQSQSAATPSNLSSVRTTFSGQPLRLAVVGQSQPIKLIVNNSVRPKFIRNVTPVKTNVITNIAQSAVGNVNTAASVRPMGLAAGQPVRLQNAVQPSNENSNKSKLQTR